MGKIGKLFAMLRNYGVGITFRVVKSKLTSGPRAQKHKLVSMIKKSMEPGKLLNEGNEKFDFEPLFSILIPLYNTDISMLKCVIESVINQSRTNWELCLADGSDTEHSYVEKICREYAADNPRIHYKKLEENLGISGNTNVCASMATGTYMVLADHDDFIHPCAIYELTKAVNISLADFIYTDEVTFEG
ncbi:MAG: glycosyltransferase, partial [Butyrivibrio sp.]